MSGIAALYEKRGAPAGEALASAMLRRLRHRGPDRSGLHVDGSVALAQCMLETTPQDAFERQPYRLPSGDLWIVADARLDNRDDLLRHDESRADDRARAVPDAALILATYERWGEACPAKLLGDFAFVIWDGAREKLFCARDHIGVRPLYYHHDAASFRCASEMHALFADPRVPKRPDRRNVALFVAGMYGEDETTLYDGVSVLPAGCSLTVAAGTVDVRAYWKPGSPSAIRYASDDDYAAHFREVFSEAVRCRLRANRPLAAEVSGGLDSSSIACEAERLRRAGLVEGPPLSLMTVAYPGLECDETVYSQAVADHLGLPIFRTSGLDDLDACRPAPLPPDHYFDPTMQGAVPLLEEAARRGIRVTLSGVGGDQLMRWTGHERLYHLRRGRVWHAAVEAGIDQAPLSATAWRGLLKDAIKVLTPPVALRAYRRIRHGDRRWPWLTPAMCEAVNEHVALAELRAAALHPDPLESALRDELQHAVSTPYALALSDRTMARFGQESRFPFLDVRVVEYLLAIPNEQRCYRGLPKPVLRRAMAGTLPALVRERGDKAEFTCYLRRGFWEPHAGAVREMLQRSQLEELGIVDGVEIRRAARRGRARRVRSDGPVRHGALAPPDDVDGAECGRVPNRSKRGTAWMRRMTRRRRPRRRTSRRPSAPTVGRRSSSSATSAS